MVTGVAIRASRSSIGKGLQPDFRDTGGAHKNTERGNGCSHSRLKAGPSEGDRRYECADLAINNRVFAKKNELAGRGHCCGLQL